MKICIAVRVLFLLSSEGYYAVSAVLLYKIKSLKDTILFSKHSGNFCYLLMSLLTNV